MAETPDSTLQGAGESLRPSLLIVDDDVGFAHAAAEVARQEGFDITIAGAFGQAVKRLQSAQFDIALIDLQLPDGSGLDLLDHFGEDGHTQAVVVTGEPTVESTLRAMRLPISDYIVKPLKLDRYRELLGRASSRRRSADATHEEDWHGLAGRSAPLLRIKQEIARVAPTEAAVLLHGESGVGKELVARALHEVSGRPGQFVAMNCGAVPHELLASQLFGHERGSFTGAHGRHIGYFEQANGGTLFLDEVTEMPAHLQVHLLRALENRSIRRVGGSEDIPVDVRIVSATNRDPQRAVRQGVLREDVFYRLAEFPITVPPLRARQEDIELLAQRFLALLNLRYGTDKQFSADALEQLRRHAWPGNVRELRNVVQRAYIMEPGDTINVQLERGGSREPIAETENSITFSVGTRLDVIERRMLFKTLAHFSNDKTRTAEALGISLKTIYNRLARYQAAGSAKQ
jgi:DNA-binding NtrC family response regulator